MLKPVVVTQMTPEFRATVPSDAEREADWFIGPYSALTWLVLSDEPKPGEKPTPLEFDIPVRGGRLSDFPALLRVAKECAFWRRSIGGERAVRDALTYVQRTKAVLNFLCALTHRGISSLSDLPSSEYRGLLELWRFGTEHLLGSADKIEAALSLYERREDVPGRLVTWGVGNQLGFARFEVMQECGFPRYVGPLTRTVFDRAAERLGLATSRNASSEADTSETTDASLKSHRGLLHWIYRQRHTLRCENFAFDPSLVSVTTTKTSTRTPIIPPVLVFKLLPACAREIEDTGDLLNDVPDALRDSNWDQKSYRFCLLVRLLTLAVTARRREELDLMRRDCLKGSDEDGWYVNVYIVKNVKGWAWIPVPPFVARAIETLIRLSPTMSMDGPLFAFQSPGSGRVRAIQDSRGALNDLAREYGAVHYLADNDVQADWHWTENQFRRFTAVMYFHGYNGSIGAISHILRHFNIGQTWGYTKYDPSLDKMWKQVQNEFLELMAQEALEGTLGGIMGQKLVRDAGKLVKHASENLEHRLKSQMADMEVIDPKNMVRAVREVIRRKGLVIVPKAWVMCSCPASASAARRAACRKQVGGRTSREVGPDFNRAGPQVCPGCMFGIENEITREFARKDMEQFRVSCASPCVEGTILGNIQQSQLVTVMKITETA
jgi:hypothetical protein